MSKISDNLDRIRQTIPSNVTLITVSKTKPIPNLMEAYEAGQRHFGENKVQELCDKQVVMPSDVHWHLIGHLQRNKVKYIAPFVHLIHSVDSLKLLAEINKEAQKNKRVIDCLLQLYIASEETKFGLSFEEARDLLSDEAFQQMNNIRIVGVMGMASFIDKQEQIREEFQSLYHYFLVLKSHFFKFNPDFKEISMGMSGDYQLAIAEGSTMVRVGSSIFGER